MPSCKGMISVAGPPYCGAAHLSQLLAEHSAVEQVEVHGAESFSELCEQSDPARPAIEFLLLSELNGARDDLARLPGLMHQARVAGVYTGLIIALDCPFTAFAAFQRAGQAQSQPTDQAFANFAESIVGALSELLWHARSQHCRVVCRSDLHAEPFNELARLLALFPLHLEPSQLALRKVLLQSGAGDAAPPLPEDIKEAAALMASLKESPIKQKMLALRRLTESTATMSTNESLERLAELIIMKP